MVSANGWRVIFDRDVDVEVLVRVVHRLEALRFAESHLDIRSRRSAVRRARTAGSGLLRLTGSLRRTSGAASGGFTGILEADAYSSFNTLYDPGRKPAPITPAFCWAQARRLFFELADIAKNARRGSSAAAISPIALEVVKRIDLLFDIERDINGLSADERLRVRQERSAPLLAELKTWLTEQRSRLSRSPTSFSPSTTCSSAGTVLPASPRTAGSVSRTMQLNAPCAARPFEGKHGCSPALIAAPTGPPS